VSLFDLALLPRIRGIRCGSIRSAALGTERKQTLAGLSNPKWPEAAGQTGALRLTVSSAVSR
jgi:hypothetical protein